MKVFAMGKRISPERREQREKLKELLQRVGITDVAGVQELLKEMVSSVLGTAWKANWKRNWATPSTTTGTRKRTQRKETEKQSWGH